MHPEKFALIFDDWNSAQKHYISVFASFPENNEYDYSTVLLAFKRIQFRSTLRLQFLSSTRTGIIILPLLGTIAILRKLWRGMLELDLLDVRVIVLFSQGKEY